jgi:hypothetical protein
MGVLCQVGAVALIAALVALAGRSVLRWPEREAIWMRRAASSCPTWRASINGPLRGADQALHHKALDPRQVLVSRLRRRPRVGALHHRS